MFPATLNLPGDFVPIMERLLHVSSHAWAAFHNSMRTFIHLLTSIRVPAVLSDNLSFTTVQSNQGTTVVLYTVMVDSTVHVAVFNIRTVQ